VRRALRLVALASAFLLLTGCGFKGAYSLPLPGGNAGGNSYHVTAVFDDVQDLVPMAAVRVDDVAVGDVTSIDYDPEDGKAHVGLRIRDSVHLPENATATLEQTTLLGEKYVALGTPTSQPPTGQLSDGDVIAENATSNLPDITEVFGVLSAVLNGGDLQDLQTINVEIAKALTGREQAVKSALTQLDTFVSGLDRQKQQIVRALDQLDRFSGALAEQTGTIATALDDLGPGLKVLADERVQFTKLLTDLSRFGKVATHIITSSRQQTVAGLRDLQPILRHLRAAGTNLPHALELLITFPFPRNINNAVPGDYNGLFLTYNGNTFSTSTGADSIFCALAPTPLDSCQNSPGALKKKGSTKKNKLLPDLPKIPDVPDVPQLPVPLPSPGGTLEDLLGAGLTGGTP
jgi:phospholipid/cholesterol/gamma-HCH transport system substrate-binding protein